MKIKLTSGAASGPTALGAFDAALRDAGVENYNLIPLSSVIPPAAEIEQARYSVPPGEYGHRLYVVMARHETSQIGEEAWAGIGWTQEPESGRGLFVELHGTSKRSVERAIEATLDSMKEARPYEYGKNESEMVGIVCEGDPVCALVIAVYESEPWSSSMTGPSDPDVTQDWAQFDPVAYLDEYYGDIGSENHALLGFLVETFRDLPKGGVLLDFGGGPTIYPLISAVHRVDEIHFSDYLEANLDEVRRWMDAGPEAFDWDPYIREALELESGEPPSDADVERRARAIRERVTRVIRCDASRTPPVDVSNPLYDIVLTNFCAESATSERKTWQAYMANILSVLKPGGWLVISALEGATRYSVGPRSFPAVDIAVEDLVGLLAENGFPSEGIEVRSVPADRTTRDYRGLMLAVAQKRPILSGSKA